MPPCTSSHLFSAPFWVTYKLILIVAAFGVAAAHLIGLAIVIAPLHLGMGFNHRHTGYPRCRTVHGWCQRCGNAGAVTAVEVLSKAAGVR